MTSHAEAALPEASLANETVQEDAVTRRAVLLGCLEHRLQFCFVGSVNKVTLTPVALRNDLVVTELIYEYRTQEKIKFA